MGAQTEVFRCDVLSDLAQRVKERDIEGQIEYEKKLFFSCTTEK